MSGDPTAKDAALIAAAQRVEHYEIAAWATVRQLAKECGCDGIEDLADQTLDEESQADKLLTRSRPAECSRPASTSAPRTDRLLPGSSIGGVGPTPPMAIPPIVWEPSPERIASATITRYREWLNSTRGLRLIDYHDLWQWSVDTLEEFWASIWDFFEVRFFAAVRARSREPRDAGRGWFPGARLSYAEHIFRGRDDAALAIATPPSSGRSKLDVGRAPRPGRAIARACAARASAGRPRRRLPPEHPRDDRRLPRLRAIGAIWSSCSPEFGAAASWTASPRSSRRCCSRSTATATAARTSTDASRSPSSEALPTLERTLVLLDHRRAATGTATCEPRRSSSPRCRSTIRSGSSTARHDRSAEGDRHGQGGILLEHLKTLRLHLDAQRRRPRSSGSRRPAG